MGALNVGRVGLEAASTDNVQAVSWRANDGRQQVTLSGRFKAATVANSQALRNELNAQTGKLVAVTWANDPAVDGFYILRNVQLQAATRDRAFDTGMFPFTIQLDRVGSESETEIQSLLTGTVLTNFHGLIAAETKPFHSAPVGHLAYNSGTGAPTKRTRTGDEGDVVWYDGILNTVDPTWSVAAAAFYTGSVRVKMSSLLRSGTDAPNDPDDWELSNTLVKVTPDTTAGVSNGRLNMSWYDGTQWDTAVPFKIVYDAGVGNNVIPQWHYVSIIRNDPETCIVRLIRDGIAAPGASPHRHILDISLRRGSLFVSFYYTWTGITVNYDLIRDSADAASAFTPTGATSSPGVLDDVATGGNKWLMVTSKTNTAQTVAGGLRVSGPKYDFMIGAEIGAAGTGDTAADQALQYFGWISERDRAVRR